MNICNLVELNIEKIKSFLKNLTTFLFIMLFYFFSSPKLALASNIAELSDGAHSQAIIPYQPLPQWCTENTVRYIMYKLNEDLHADLRLPVFVNPSVLFDPSLTSSLYDSDVFSTDTEGMFYSTNSREYIDSIRLNNIQRILRERDQYSALNFLRNLSWQISGMNVFKRLLRDRHQVKHGEEGSAWELLSFLHHGLAYPNISDNFMAAFVSNIQPFLKVFPRLINNILQHEQSRSRMLGQHLGQVRSITKQVYQAHIYQKAKEEGISEHDAEVFSTFSNEPHKLFENVDNNPFISPKRQFELSFAIAWRYATSNLNWRALEDLIDLEKAFQSNEKVLMQILHHVPEATSFVKLSGILYELSSLDRVQNLRLTLDSLKVGLSERLSDDKQADQIFAFLKQSIVYYGEAIDDITTPLAPDLGEGDDALSLRYLVKWLRNRIEHPEEGRHSSLPSPSKRYQDIRLSPHFSAIVEGIINDLLEIANRVEKRAAFLRSIISCPTEDVESLLSEILIRPPLTEPLDSELEMLRTSNQHIEKISASVNIKKERDLRNQLHWALAHPIPTLHQLRRYLINQSYTWLPVPISAGDLRTAAIAVFDAEKGKSKHKMHDVTFIDARVSINNIRQLIGVVPIDLLVSKLSQDIIFRFASIHHLQQVHYVFDTLIDGSEIKKNVDDLAFYFNLPKHKRHILKQIYDILQDRRNMLIHDLWREDTAGLANILMLLVYVFDPLLFESLEVVDESTSDCSSYISQSTDSEEDISIIDPDGNLSYRSSNEETEISSMAATNSFRTHITIDLTKEESMEVDKNLFPYKIIDQEEWDFIYAHSNPTQLLIDHFNNATATPILVNALIMRGADMDGDVFNAYRPIHKSIIDGDIRMLKHLLKWGANPNSFSFKRVFPLHLAVEYGNATAVQLLLEFGAIPMVLDGRGCTPYDLAVENGNEPIQELLKPYQPSLRGDPADRLMRAVKHRDLEGVRAAIKSGIGVNLFSEEGELPIVQALNTYNPFMFEETEEAILELETIVAELINAGARVDLPEYSSGEHAIYKVSGLGLPKLANILYEKAQDVSLRTEHGETALHLAALLDEEATVASLLSKKAKVNVISKIYGTPLLANVNKRKGGHIGILRKLLRQGANPNYQNSSYWSALHYVAESNDLDSAELLLRFGANPFLLNIERKTPFDVASNYRMKRLLSEWMGYLKSKINPFEERLTSYRFTQAESFPQQLPSNSDNSMPRSSLLKSQIINFSPYLTTASAAQRKANISYEERAIATTSIKTWERLSFPLKGKIEEQQIIFREPREINPDFKMILDQVNNVESLSRLSNEKVLLIYIWEPEITSTDERLKLKLLRIIDEYHGVGAGASSVVKTEIHLIKLSECNYRLLEALK